MANHMEDEEKIGENQEIIKAEQEEKPAKANNNSLIKSYLEDKEQEKAEEKEEIEKAKNHTITTETKKYRR